MTYIELITILEENNLAMKNYLSYPHINVVGSIITGSHGGGIDRKSIATFVIALEYVDAEGNVKTVSRDRDADFD